MAVATVLFATTPAASLPAGSSPAALSGLAGSSWRLEKIETSDPTAGLLKPAPALYQIAFTLDGVLTLQLGCNRAVGRWSVQPSGPRYGTLSLSPGAITREACPAGSLDARVARDVERVRSYVVDGAFLTLQGDGGVYTWRRNTPMG